MSRYHAGNHYAYDPDDPYDNFGYMYSTLPNNNYYEDDGFDAWFAEARRLGRPRVAPGKDHEADELMSEIRAERRYAAGDPRGGGYTEYGDRRYDSQRSAHDPTGQDWPYGDTEEYVPGDSGMGGFSAGEYYPGKYGTMGREDRSYGDRDYFPGEYRIGDGYYD